MSLEIFTLQRADAGDDRGNAPATEAVGEVPDRPLAERAAQHDHRHELRDAAMNAQRQWKKHR